MIRAFFLVAAFCFWLTGLGWTSPLLGMFEQGNQRFLVRERAGQLSWYLTLRTERTIRLPYIRPFRCGFNRQTLIN